MKSHIYCIVCFFIFISIINCSGPLAPDEFLSSMISTDDKIFTSETIIDSLAVFSIERTKGDGSVRGKEEKKCLLSLRITIENDSNFLNAVSEIFLIDDDSIFASQTNLSKTVIFDSLDYVTNSTVFMVGCKRKSGEGAHFTLSINGIKMQFWTGAGSTYGGGSEWFQDTDNMKYDSTDSILQTKNSGLITIKD